MRRCKRFRLFAGRSRNRRKRFGWHLNCIDGLLNDALARASCFIQEAYRMSLQHVSGLVEQSAQKNWFAVGAVLTVKLFANIV